MADDERSRYTDEHLSDTFVWITNELQRVGRQLNGLPAKQVQMESELRAVRDDTSECRQGVDKLNAALEQRAKERKAEAEERKAERAEARREKRQDRALIVTTAIASGGLIVAAIQVLGIGPHP